MKKNLDEECCLCEATETSYKVDEIWWLCSRCYNLESDGIGNTTDSGLIKLKPFYIKVETKKFKKSEPTDASKLSSSGFAVVLSSLGRGLKLAA